MFVLAGFCSGGPKSQPMKVAAEDCRVLILHYLEYVFSWNFNTLYTIPTQDVHKALRHKITDPNAQKTSLPVSELNSEDFPSAKAPQYG